MTHQQGGTWLYYKLMTGVYYWAFDHLILSLSPIVQDARVRQWFFIRYLDEDGPHLRLRLCVESASANAFDREVYAKLHELVTRLPRLPVEEVSRLVTIPLPDFDKSKLAFGVKRVEYKPETDIYGNEEGVAVAEHLFQASSEMAMEVIAAERQGEVSRKELAPALMNAALDEFPISKPPSEFLVNYMNYWASGIPSSGSYIVTFENKCRELMASGTPIVRRDDEYGSMLAGQLDKWRKSLRETQAAYKRINGYSEALAEQVLFYFIHLMNNRLGFAALDETYLAMLVNGWKGSRKTA
jgi:thiopeptide-type bacteriocin biosynthesis protein